jgi:Ca2+-binding EF-hand superfamily protein
MDSFFSSRISIKFKLRRYMALGLKTAQHFVEKAKNFYEAKFKSYDKAKQRMLDFKTFEDLIKSLDPNRPQWRIISIFEYATGQRVDTNVMITYEQFINAALNNE